jgi:hypothetical protein
MISTLYDAKCLVVDVAQFSVSTLSVGVEKKSVKDLVDNCDLAVAVVGFADCIGYSSVALKAIAQVCKTTKDVARIFYLRDVVVNLPCLMGGSLWNKSFLVSEYIRKSCQSLVALYTVMSVSKNSNFSLGQFKNIVSISEFTSGLTGFLKSEQGRGAPAPQFSSKKFKSLNWYKESWARAEKISLFVVATIGFMSFVPAVAPLVPVAIGSGLAAFGGLSISSVLGSSFTVPVLLLIARVSKLFNKYVDVYLDRQKVIDAAPQNYADAIETIEASFDHLALSVQNSLDRQQGESVKLDKSSLIWARERWLSAEFKVSELNEIRPYRRLTYCLDGCGQVAQFVKNTEPGREWSVSRELVVGVLEAIQAYKIRIQSYKSSITYLGQTLPFGISRDIIDEESNAHSRLGLS